MTFREARGESGAATVLVVAMAGVLMFVMVGLAAVGGLVTAQRRAQAAADLAALGGASALAGVRGSADACAAAARVAGANAAALDACTPDGRTVRVTVSVDGPDVPWREVRVSAEARAGPG
ncbi:Rv3654c family TadE-like protein [uncultured Nocardioides sp.]|uniref:Rv3654c family TadE-like protein n=1 Tax=uncultured Nocardioides sp. TaxID=198441 RepID=UPI00263619DE|nr:Rv3654c family TadE-like protein [uncultured Nocardioides sp.]